MVEDFEDDSIKENKNEHSPEDFYKSLREKLDNNHNFPEDYLFKFIFPNDHSRLMKLYQIFDEIKYSITTRESKNGKYLSASILAFVLDANQVTDIYQKASVIEGIMML